ncbi:hypothetical protein ACFWAR_00005 [Streptomyces sp. NPDC059917]|uniref:hypothetical protein n=1 Tax=Streptomyces sp. NPDC059917 TaxID=3347002 RepID=UPI003655E992
MSNDPVYRVTIQLPVDRSIFGINETAPAGKGFGSLLSWTDLEMDSTPVRVSPGAIRFMSLVGTHEPLVTIEVGENPPVPPASAFELVGHDRYRSTSGDATLYTIDGPHISFILQPDTEYTLRVWRKGREGVQERYDELLGQIYPIVSLEEYVIQFSD